MATAHSTASPTSKPEPVLLLLPHAPQPLFVPPPSRPGPPSLSGEDGQGFGTSDSDARFRDPKRTRTAEPYSKQVLKPPVRVATPQQAALSQRSHLGTFRIREGVNLNPCGLPRRCPSDAHPLLEPGVPQLRE